jgi:hypothetical protein
MKTWTPLITAIVISLILFAIPILTTNVTEGGWALYYLLIPIIIVVFGCGFLTSIILFLARLGKSNSEPADSAREN